MILKRIVPVISALMILVCMLAVPASAASYHDPDMYPTLFYSIADFSLDLYLSNGDVLALECPRIIPREGLSYTGSVSSNVGSISYGWVSSYRGYGEEHGFDFLQWSLIVDPSVQIVAFDLYFTDVPLVYDESFFGTFIEVSAPNYSSADKFSSSLSVLIPNEDHKPQEVNLAASSSGLFNFGNPVNLYDKMEIYNVEFDSHMLISKGKIHGDLNGHNQLNFTSMFASDRSLIPNSNEFWFDNGLDFERPLYSEVTTSGFVQFLTRGVGAFMDTPIFGDIGLGDLLGVFISVLLVTVLIRMFAS